MKLKNRLLKKSVAFITTFAMVVTMIPAMSAVTFAEEDDNAPVLTFEGTEEVTEEAPEAEPPEAPATQDEAAVETEETEQVEDITDEALAESDDQIVVTTDEIVIPFSQKTDSDKLLSGYIDRELGLDDDMGLMGTLCRDKLTGLNKTMYNYLTPKIKAIAGGSTSISQIKVQLASSDIKTTWTAKELGVSSFTSSNVVNCLKKIPGKANLDAETLMKSLIYDMPYEMYWFDKTIGMGWSSNISTKTWTSTKLTINPPEFIFNFRVTQDYSRDNVRDSLYVNKTKTQAIQRTVENINSAVEAQKSVADYDRLVNFTKLICNNVSYDYNASAGNVPYGDPWQLISVFDGDSSTNVVCEGYSKAMQYLCDLTTERGYWQYPVSCYSVSGTTSGPHMWNIVTMEDGYNYLLDITNIDIGYDDLFLTSPYDGSVAEGYRFDVGSGRLARYTYDSDMPKYFGNKLQLNADEPYTSPDDHDFVVHFAIDNGNRCTATLVCQDDYCTKEITLPGTCEVVDKTPATETEVGSKTIKASIKYGNRTFTGSGTLEVASPATFKLSHASVTYTGKALSMPTVTVYDTDGEIIPANQYTITKPASMKAIGIYKYKVTFKDCYEGAKTLNYTVKPVPTKITKLTRAKKAFTVKWTKKTSQVTGYQIQYSTSSKFTSGNKTSNVSSYKTYTRKIKGLKAKKKYYVRVRTYKTVSGTKIYSNWSPVKAVTTK